NPRSRASRTPFKEIEQVVCACCPEAEGIDISLLEHVSPIEWDIVLPYGQDVIDRSLVRIANRPVADHGWPGGSETKPVYGSRWSMICDQGISGALQIRCPR